MPEPLSIEIDPGERVSGRIYRATPERRAGIALLLAHGAGAGQTSPFLVRFATGLAERGVAAVIFNFDYMERHRRVPDPNHKLETCYRAAIRGARSHGRLAEDRLAIGGKSMGGRIASQVAAGGIDDVSALVFLGYPLHPPGKPAELRAAHLPQIKIPMLFVQGSRDSFGTPAELRPIVEKLRGNTELHVVDHGDHSFKVPKRTGVAQEAIYDAILDGISAWLRRVLTTASKARMG
jgi:uncharacterized protein